MQAAIFNLESDKNIFMELVLHLSSTVYQKLHLLKHCENTNSLQFLSYRNLLVE